MEKLKLTIVLLFSCMSHYMVAQNALKDKVAVKNHSDKVMMFFGKSDFDSAFQELRKFYPVSELDYQTLKTKSTENLRSATVGFGKITGDVFISEEILKDFAVRRNYLIKLEKILLRFNIVYYNGIDGWIVNSFNWDDNFEVYFEKSN